MSCIPPGCPDPSLWSSAQCGSTANGLNTDISGRKGLWEGKRGVRKRLVSAGGLGADLNTKICGRKVLWEGRMGVSGRLGCAGVSWCQPVSAVGRL